jgi:soluble lytic murein transglycosylase-like protein
MSYSVQNGLIYLNGALVTLSDTEKTRLQSNVVQRWGSLASAYSQKYGVPLSWTLAIINAESGGNSRAYRVEPDGSTGVGLMQITSPALKRGLSDEQVFVPETNLDIGVQFLAHLMSLGNRDLPAVASCYNCGPGPDGLAKPAPTQNPAWGICAYSGYLDRVSGAANALAGMTTTASQGSATVPWKPLAFAGAAILALRWALK